VKFRVPRCVFAFSLRGTTKIVLTGKGKKVGKKEKKEKSNYELQKKSQSAGEKRGGVFLFLMFDNFSCFRVVECLIFLCGLFPFFTCGPTP
jgi:hypothetical protein